jgi:hypothetical protein
MSGQKKACSLNRLHRRHNKTSRFIMFFPSAQQEALE